MIPLFRCTTRPLTRPLLSGAPLATLRTRRADICAQCLVRTTRLGGRGFGTTRWRGETGTATGVGKAEVNAAILGGKFFKADTPDTMSSSLRDAGKSSDGGKTEGYLGSESDRSQLPHRRRQAAKKLAAQITAEELASAPVNPATVISPDASSLLSSESQSLPQTSFKRTFYTYLSLSKPRLTVLVVLTTMTSYALFPVDPLLAPTAGVPSLSALTLLYLTTGTALSSASANAFNMLLEPKFDAQMSRTRNRPLVRGLLSKRHALIFAVVCGLTGVTLLHFGVNPTVSVLGATNIILYSFIYTPLKRLSILNTWVGALVGGIPPLMGWAAASGSNSTTSDLWEPLSQPGAWVLAGILFAWQFPHFNALSWTIREEYKRAGYQMAAWKYPSLNARVALRYSLAFFPLSILLSYYHVTDWGFAVTSSVANAWALREAVRFWKEQNSKTAKGLFWASVWHLPVLMGLAMAHKEGLWRGMYTWGRGVMGYEMEGWEEREGRRPVEVKMVE